LRLVVLSAKRKNRHRVLKKGLHIRVLR
jgi:hypothetical protein